MGEEESLLRSLYADNGLEDRTLALLDPLTHRVEVGCEVARSGEDAFSVLTLRLAVELLPPLAHEVELGLEVDKNLDLLACLCIESVTHSSVNSSGVLIERHVLACGLLHVGSTLDESSDVEAGNSDRQQAYGCEHRETSTHIVGNDECLVTLLCSGSACSTLVSVGNGYDHVLSLLLAALVLTLLLEQTEGESGLGSCARL